jgi:hypothetical protein
LAFFLANPLAQNPNARFKYHAQQAQKSAWIYRMTKREKLNLAGLAFGITATFGWIGLMGFALSQSNKVAFISPAVRLPN